VLELVVCAESPESDELFVSGLVELLGVGLLCDELLEDDVVDGSNVGIGAVLPFAEPFPLGTTTALLLDRLAVPPTAPPTTIPIMTITAMRITILPLVD